MNRIATAVTIAAAFAAGCGMTYLLRQALSPESITAQVIHTGDLSGDGLGPSHAGGMRAKRFVNAEGATISIQDGNAPKHMHPNTNEIQYILEGTGTIWLGDKEVKVGPGDLVIIPKGTPHGGPKPEGRALKGIAIKPPPQAPDDTKMLD